MLDLWDFVCRYYILIKNFTYQNIIYIYTYTYILLSSCFVVLFLGDYIYVWVVALMHLKMELYDSLFTPSNMFSLFLLGEFFILHTLVYCVMRLCTNKIDLNPEG